MTSYVLRQASAPGKSPIATEDSIVDLAAAATKGELTPGLYLEWFDVDAGDGRGADLWTHDEAKAMRFATLQAALEAWQTQSRLVPLRPDGEPNRPLTAYSVAVQRVEP